MKFERDFLCKDAAASSDASYGYSRLTALFSLYSQFIDTNMFKETDFARLFYENPKTFSGKLDQS